MPDAHPTAHLFWTLALAGVSAGLMAAVRNPLIRRRLLVAVILLAAATALHGAIVWLPDNAFLQTQGWKIEAVMAAFAVFSAFVSLLFNPWSEDRTSERTPAIIQDAVVVALVIVAAVFAFRVSSLDFLAGSAIVAAIVGFALQETLGNAFAGIAIQIDKPFRVGHWISVGGFEGVVSEVTWRATKIRTKAGNMVIVPNNIVAREPINNYSQPTTPTRLHVEVGATYDVAPNDVRRACWPRLRNPRSSANRRPRTCSSRILLDRRSRTGSASGLMTSASRKKPGRRSDRSSTTSSSAERSRFPGRFRSNTHARSRRPIRPSAANGSSNPLPPTPVFASLPEDGHRALAMAADEQVFADGEIIMREGDPGGSMFLVCRGKVAVTIGRRSPGGRDHGSGRLLRRDVALDRRAANRDGRRAR